MKENEKEMVETEEPQKKKTRKRGTKSKKAEPGFSPKEIETRYQAFLEKIRGGK